MKLKTLNDLFKEWKPKMVNENDLQKMEHIELSYTGELVPFEIVEGDLKAEAIKWVKEWRSDERLGYPTATIDINAPLALIQLEGETKIKLFKNFFNITEEDLE